MFYDSSARSGIAMTDNFLTPAQGDLYIIGFEKPGHLTGFRAHFLKTNSRRNREFAARLTLARDTPATTPPPALAPAS